MGLNVPLPDSDGRVSASIGSRGLSAAATSRRPWAATTRWLGVTTALSALACQAPESWVRALDPELSGATTIILQRTPTLVARVVVPSEGFDWTQVGTDVELWSYDQPPEDLGLTPGALSITERPADDLWALPAPARVYGSRALEGWVSLPKPTEPLYVRSTSCPAFSVERRTFPPGAYPRQGQITSFGLLRYGEDVFFSWTQLVNPREGGSWIRPSGDIYVREKGPCSAGGFTSGAGRFVCSDGYYIFTASVSADGPGNPSRNFAHGRSVISRVLGRDDDESIAVLTGAGPMLGDLTSGLVNGPSVVLDDWILAPLGPRRAAGAALSSVVIFTATTSVQTPLGGGVITDLVDVPGLGLLAGTGAGELFVQGPGRWRALRSPFLDGSGVIALVRHPRGFAAVLTSGVVVHGDAKGQLCPPVRVSSEPILGLANRLGRCSGGDCRWVATALVLVPDKLIIVRPNGEDE